ncbi:MAG: extracellular solute-binding protein [Bacteroidales bacterium]|nr:extracellular solute-binding protein [Lachnoclostridium sp.]MCM1384623.1 extracellular solute-binding protein [Lachnoclostridium sp.]MCM1463838.1 extracellular solute-binding protein [Bacteroidales bacterium]
MKYTLKRNSIASAMVIIFLVLASCGKQDDSPTADNSNANAQKVSYAYVPEYVELVGAETANIDDSRIIGDALYYTKIEAKKVFSSDEAEKVTTMEDGQRYAVKRFLYEYSLAEQKVIRKMLLSDGSGVTYDIRVAEDGRVYVSDYDFEDSYGKILVFDKQGELQMSVDFKTLGARHSQAFAVDAESRLYISMTNGEIALINADGTLHGKIALKDNNYVSGIGTGKDGKVYVSYRNMQQATSGAPLAEIDFEGKKLSDKVYQNYPVSMHHNLIAGNEYDFLVNDGSSLYGYQLESESAERLFTWAECGISTNPMGTFACAEDGTIKVLTRCGIGRESAELTVLTKTDAATLPEKTELVLGTLHAAPDLKAAVVAFNRQSDTCHITIKDYTDGEDAHAAQAYIPEEEALQNINIDIISADNCPDIFDLYHFNVEALAGNGVFENLEPYFEQSTVVKKEDFLENVVDNYTYNGILTAVPATVTLSTMMGRSDIVGEKIGWTFEEMAEIIDKNPDIQPENFPSNQSILQICLKFGYEDFIDWENDKADFDCEKFKNILKFAGRYPSPNEMNYDFSERSSKKMREGELLLSTAFISAFQDIQVQNYVYGGVTFIGYPTADGSNGCDLFTTNACAIASKSKHKEEAWAFIEFLLSGEMNEWSEDSFPCKKDDLMKKITAVEYRKDSNGNISLSIIGEPLLRYDTVSYDGVKYEYHAVTQEEAALCIQLLETAKFDTSNDSVISRIIYEEAEGFFKNQKTVDDVAAIIQNRVQLYLDENW